jgi:flavodoxin
MKGNSGMEEPRYIALKISYYIVIAIFASVFLRLPICDAADGKKIKIIIIYSSGVPTSDWQKFVAQPDEAVDIISSPTHKHNNVSMIADNLSKLFDEEKFDVKTAKVDEIKKADDVLAYDVLLLGSGSHFGLMSWEMKRFFDVCLYPIYIHKEEKLRNQFVGTFTVSQTVNSGNDCIDSMKRALSDFEPKELDSFIVLNNYSSIKIQKKLNKYTKQLSKVLSKKFR